VKQRSDTARFIDFALKKPSKLHVEITLILGFRRDVDEICGLLTREYGIDTLSRNVGKQLPHDAA
jgi:hypothetical protein